MLEKGKDLLPVVNVQRLQKKGSRHMNVNLHTDNHQPSALTSYGMHWKQDKYSVTKKKRKWVKMALVVKITSDTSYQVSNLFLMSLKSKIYCRGLVKHGVSTKEWHYGRWHISEICLDRHPLDHANSSLLSDSPRLRSGNENYQ